jgi:hypothetical protein
MGNSCQVIIVYYTLSYSGSLGFYVIACSILYLLISGFCPFLVVLLQSLLISFSYLPLTMSSVNRTFSVALSNDSLQDSKPIYTEFQFPFLVDFVVLLAVPFYLPLLLFDVNRIVSAMLVRSAYSECLNYFIFILSWLYFNFYWQISCY